LHRSFKGDALTGSDPNYEPMDLKFPLNAEGKQSFKKQCGDAQIGTARGRR